MASDRTAGWVSDLERASNLTRSQYLIWSGQELNPSSPLYNMAMAFRMEGALDVERFVSSFEGLVAGTDSLRMVFRKDGSTPMSVILDEITDPIQVLDLSGSADPERTAVEWMQDQTETMFDLSEKTFRSALIDLGESRWIWFFNQHHLVTDGWSVGVLFRRLASIYAGDDGEAGFPQYRFYTEYERSLRGSEQHSRALTHWDCLAEEPPALSFYGRMPTPGDTRTNRWTLRLDAETTSRIKELGDDGESLASLSEYDVVMTALLAYLHRVTGESSLSVLTPVHSRPSRALKETAGLFIEVLPFSAEVKEGDTFADLLSRVADESLSVLSNAMPATSSAESNRSRSVLLNFINASLGEFDGVSVETDWIHSGHGDAEHMLRLQVHDFDGSGRFTFHFDLDAEVFDDALARLTMRHFESVLRAMLADPDSSIADVDLMDQSERRALMEGFNETSVHWPHATVLDAFSEQLTLAPEAPAVVDAELTLSYEELDRLSDSAAARFRAISGPGSRIALHLDRSAEFVIAVMGAMKAQAVFIPVDTETPSIRLRHIVDDAEVSILVSNDRIELEPEVGFVEATTLLTEAALQAGDEGSLDPAAEAYVLYTSGSTGQPKGVVVRHVSLSNYVHWAKGQYVNEGAADFPLYSSIGFDLTLTSLFVPLASGGRVVVYRDREDGTPSVVDVFEDDIVDVVKLTPSHLSVIPSRLLHPDRIRTLILGGEDLKTQLANAVLEASSGEMTIYNEYGPTEATVGSMIHRFDPESDSKSSVPIGRPIANTQVYILDSQLRPSPSGVVGELYIGGDGLATGYLGKDELTAQSFVANPFLPGERLYRTGDLARWATDRTIEFLGRADGQVKIRGHRIELGEIEGAVLAHPGVNRAHVAVVDADTFVVSNDANAGCSRCGLSPLAPGGRQDDEGICETCIFFEEHRVHAEAYFGVREDLEGILTARRSVDDRPDCLMLLSGGKDSSYALYQLVEMGARPLAFTLDNGFISEGAKDNMRRVCDDLGVELVEATTPGMNAMFADSLENFSNVCQGCFKTIYTLALNLAWQRGIETVVTGLSRGQIFETRLADLFRIGITEPDAVDEAIVDGRKAYHRAGGVAEQVLPCSLFETDAVFDEIAVVDFYRYVDVELAEVFEYLDSRGAWVRPPDTGRSTNCLINATGIFVHKRERGYHNYAVPYAWDVRLGHKTREAALEELDDEIDVGQVRKTLDEVGYEPASSEAPLVGGSGKRLALYYTAEDQQADNQDVRRFIADRLPSYMIPSFLVPMDEIPLNRNGKVDGEALPDPRQWGRRSTGEFKAPRNEAERMLVEVWQSVLQVEDIGINDSFFELGGDSIVNVQIVARARERGVVFRPQDLFAAKTIANLAPRVMVSQPVALIDRAPAIDPSIGEDDLASILSSYGEG